MLLCPKCQDSNWAVVSNEKENVVRCVSLVIDGYMKSLPFETAVIPMMECGVTFYLPLWFCFPPTASRKSSMGVDAGG